jgi:hypothetical protein
MVRDYEVKVIQLKLIDVNEKVVLQLCSEHTRARLFSLFSQESPQVILGTALSLYFIRMFLKTRDGDTILSNDWIVMLLSALMWVSPMEGIEKVTEHTFTTSRMGGIFLGVQSGVKY